MKALSVRQPFAWAMLHAGKDIENRTWRTDYRGPLVLHAGRAWHAIGPGDLSRRMGIAVPGDLPRGGIVGVVDVTDCVSASASPWWMGPVGFVVVAPAALPFIPCPGRLGIYDLDAATREAVLEAAAPALAARLLMAEGTT